MGPVTGLKLAIVAFAILRIAYVAAGSHAAFGPALDSPMCTPPEIPVPAGYDRCQP